MKKNTPTPPAPTPPETDPHKRAELEKLIAEIRLRLDGAPAPAPITNDSKPKPPPRFLDDAKGLTIRHRLLAVLYTLDPQNRAVNSRSASRKTLLEEIKEIEALAGPVMSAENLDFETIRLVLRQQLRRLDGISRVFPVRGVDFPRTWQLLEKAGLWRARSEWRGTAEDLHAILTDPDNGLSDRECRGIPSLAYLRGMLREARMNLGEEYVGFSRPKDSFICDTDPDWIWILSHRGATAAVN
jgi:hypothetical protein